MTTETLQPPAAEPENPVQPFLFAVVARNVLVVIMCACVALAIIGFAQQFAPNTTFAPVLVVAILVAADTLYVRQKNTRVSFFSKEGALTSLSRWGVILIVLKLVTNFGHDVSSLVGQLPSWRANPLMFFWDGPFALALLTVLMVWLVSNTLGEDLAHITEGERSMMVDPAVGALTDRVQTRQAMGGHIFGFGLLAAVFGGAANRLAPAPGQTPFPVGVDLVVYSALGLVLLSLTQLTVLRANWLWERTPMDNSLVKRWTLLGLGFVGVLTGLVLLLPIGAAAGVLPLLTEGVKALLVGFQLIGYAIYGLIGLLLLPIAGLFSLFQSPNQNMPIQPQMPAPIAPAEVPPPMELPPWLQNVQTVIFYLIIAILIGYAVLFVLRQHSGLRNALNKLPLVIWLRAGWRGLLGLLRGLRSELANLGPIPHEPPAPAITPLADEATATTTRPLVPREQVRAVYVAMLERAAEQGVPARTAQTPYEYEQTLVKVAPEANADIEQITQQFVDARYSQHDVPEERVSWVKQLAERIRRSFHALR